MPNLAEIRNYDLSKITNEDHSDAKHLIICSNAIAFATEATTYDVYFISSKMDIGGVASYSMMLTMETSCCRWETTFLHFFFFGIYTSQSI